MSLPIKIGGSTARNIVISGAEMWVSPAELMSLGGCTFSGRKKVPWRRSLPGPLRKCHQPCRAGPLGRPIRSNEEVLGISWGYSCDIFGISVGISQGYLRDILGFRDILGITWVLGIS